MLLLNSTSRRVLARTSKQLLVSCANNNKQIAQNTMSQQIMRRCMATTAADPVTPRILQATTSQNSSIILDQIKVEYAFETARIRLYLPTKGETWFFIDNAITIKEFKNQCQAEDSFLTEVKLLDKNGKEFSNEETETFYNILAHGQAQIFIKLNDNIHQFPSAKVQNHSTSSLTNDASFKLCTSKGLSPTHSSTIATFMNLFNNQIQARKGVIQGQNDLVKALSDSVKFFDDVVVREEIYKLNLHRIQIKDQIEKLEVQKAILDARSAFRNKLFFNTTFALFAAQFGISYYCIYEVEWLGWDLVEPLTYSIGQGLFVAGLVYSLRNYGKDTSFTSIDKNYHETRLARWYNRNGVDPDRLKYLKEELATVQKKIRVAESQRYV
eukprot:403343635